MPQESNRSPRGEDGNINNIMVNIAEATTEEEIFKFIVSTEKDKVGTYHILTGYEGTGQCFWCGEELVGRQKRYCRHNAHWREYWRHFNWGFARDWCIERYDDRCANCGTAYRDLVENFWYRRSNLEVHHIIPLEGRDRIWTPYNLPWNLIPFCHKCHGLVHIIMSSAKISSLAIARGQLALEGIP